MLSLVHGSLAILSSELWFVVLWLLYLTELRLYGGVCPSRLGYVCQLICDKNRQCKETRNLLDDLLFEVESALTERGFKCILVHQFDKVALCGQRSGSINVFCLRSVLYYVFCNDYGVRILCWAGDHVD